MIRLLKALRQQQKRKLNLSAMFVDLTKTSGNGHLNVVPYDSHISGDFGTVKHFDTGPIYRSYVKTILKTQSTHCPHDAGAVSLKDVLKKTHVNVCAIARTRGLPIATGVLIAPDLLLTARHALENVPIKELRIHQNHPDTEFETPYGSCHNVEGIVEENAELDYAIVQLSKSVHSEQLNLCMGDNCLGGSMLIHFADGYPKQVSVHTALESNYAHVQYAGFHDSYKGSSGGVYINPDGKLFDLHLLRSLNNVTTGAVWIKDIMEASDCMKTVYNECHTCRNLSKNMLSPSEHSAQYHVQLRVGRPSSLPPANSNNQNGNVELACHHIIPIGDMEFLWVMGQEYPDLGTELTTLATQNRSKRFINAIAWAPWNLMIGPAKEHRSDDPGDQIEEVKPFSFSNDLWEALNNLHELIKEAWDERFKLAQKHLSNVPENRNQYRASEIYRFCSLVYTMTIGNILNRIFDYHGLQQIGPYGACILKVMQSINEVKKCKSDKVHPYKPTEWRTTQSGKHSVNPNK